MITLFGIPKPFEGHIGVIQENAIASWARLGETHGAQVILVGDDAGVAECAEAHGVEHVPGVAVNEFGTPRVDDIFRRALERARHPRMCYANADIVFLEDFAGAVESVEEACPGDWLLVGQRWDVEVPERIDVSDPEWEERLRARAVETGELHAPSGIDFFAFPTEYLRSIEIPPFSVGRPRWDNWMIHQARSRGARVVDATPSLMVIHQDHDYFSLSPKGKPGIKQGPEADHNEGLAGGIENCLTITSTSHVLRGRRVTRPRDYWHVREYLETLPEIDPRARLPVRIADGVLRRWEALRERMGRPLDDEDRHAYWRDPRRRCPEVVERARAAAKAAV